MGGKTVELKRHFYHSNEGYLFIYVPEAKFLMAIDCVTPGYTPFQGFDLTTNFDQYLKLFDRLEAYDFATFVGGHLTQIGTKQDVEIAREFAVDVYQTVKRIHNNMDQNAVVAEAAKTIGTDDKFFFQGRSGQGYLRVHEGAKSALDQPACRCGCVVGEQCACCFDLCRVGR